MRLLLESGAMSSKRRTNGITPFPTASSSGHERGHDAVMDLLGEHVAAVARVLEEASCAPPPETSRSESTEHEPFCRRRAREKRTCAMCGEVARRGRGAPAGAHSSEVVGSHRDQYCARERMLSFVPRMNWARQGLYKLNL